MLRKAHRLYTSGACHLMPSGQANSFVFQISEEDVKIRRKQKKLSEAQCTCRNSPMCEHVAAAMFFLDGLQMQSTKHKSVKYTKQKSLQNEFRKQQSAATLLQHKTRSLRDLLLLYLVVSEDTQYANRTEELSKLEKKIRAKWRPAASLEEQELWTEALKIALRSNTAIVSEAYRFLLPLFLLSKHSVIQRAEIELLLKKRHYKRFHNDGPDYLEIARIQTILSTKRQTKADIAAMTSIEVLAYVQLLTFDNKVDKAKALLLQVLEKERSNTQLFGSKLLYFAMQCAQNLHDKNLIRAVLMQRLRESVQADTAVIEGIRQLASQNEFRALMLKLALQTDHMYTEKKAALLMYSADRQAMIDFAKVVPLRFNLLLALLAEALPLTPPNVVDLLAKNTVLALRQSSRLEWQTQVLKQCQMYLKYLAASQRKLVIEKIQANLGERSHLAEFLEKFL